MSDPWKDYDRAQRVRGVVEVLVVLAMAALAGAALLEFNDLLYAPRWLQWVLR